MKYIKFFKDLGRNDAEIAGGKGASLGEMTNAKIPVPPGFVVLSSAFEFFLKKNGLVEEIEAVLEKIDHKEIEQIDRASETIQAMILSKEIPEELLVEIGDSFKKLDAKFVAVRSSATAEDGASNAWAGQLDSFLNTTEKKLSENIRRCFASLFTPRAIFYRFEKGLNESHISVAVVVQKMVNSEKSGIAFSVHPVTEDRNQMIIEASWGLGEAIVSGQVTPDSYVVEKEPRNILDVNISEKTRGLFRHLSASGPHESANIWKDIPQKKAEEQCLSGKEILEFSELILKIENHYGFPCDIEWAFEDGKFYITQSRPITTLKNVETEKLALEKSSSVTVPFDGNDEWMLAENIPDSDIFFFQIPWSCFTDDTSFPFLKLYKEVLSDYQGFELNFYFGKKDSFEVAESILIALVERPKFGGDINKNVTLWSKKLVAFAEKVYKSDLSKLSSKALFAIYEKHDQIHTKLYTYGWLPVAVDMFHNNFTDKLKEYLGTVCSNQAEIEDAFVALTTPSKKTIIAEEREGFLKVYTKYLSEIKKIAQGKQKTPSTFFEKALASHGKKWGHLGYIYAGNAERFGLKHYLDEMIDLVKSGITADSILKKEKDQLKAAGEKKKRLYKKLQISPLYKRLFDTAIGFSLTKLVRRDAQLYTLYALHHSLLPEIAKRLSVTRQHVQFMLRREVKDGLIDGKIDRKILDERLKSCVLYNKHNFEEVYIGAEAELFLKGIKKDFDNTQTEFKGQIAQPGFATGVVKIVIRAKDMSKMNQGDILVSIATDPDIVPAMKKAAAIITEQGGITSHAAIVSRELGTPCIIGTKIATKVLKDGDVVEVNAEIGTVTILKKVNEN